jgi:predicted phosphoribosyltransferase
MAETNQPRALFPTRSGAGASLGQHLYGRVRQPVLMLGVTPSGVEVAASAAKAIGCEFDVIVASHIRLEQLGIIGAVAEDADAVIDPEFEPRFSMLEAMEDAIDRARRAVKRERLLFRGQRPLRSVAGKTVVIVEGHLTSPWKTLAAVAAVAGGEPAHLAIAAPVGTKVVQERMRARRVDFVCPSVVMDPGGHPRPFGDPGDPSAERLRSIVVAREAA